MSCERGAFPWREAPAIAPLRAVTARFVRRPWPWAEANRARIEAYWREAKARRPRLFNGAILLSRRPQIRDGHYEAVYQPVDFAAFLTWRDLGWPDPGMVNGFSMAALRGADGAFVAGVQGRHTANGGSVYFAAGTPDLSDVRPDGAVDLAGNIVRELREETGLDAAGLAFAPGWTAVLDGGRAALVREARSPLPAEELARRIRAHIAADPEAELADVVVIRSAADIDPARMQPFMRAWLAWRFAQE
ncbi:NUDIX hydrolase [Camelimonas abortus]|uniref:NUDIX hydrolase n=1 Tax=Camelimonas abortus TaxID=1017184 RepID=A0ABV7LI41_9HYPH